MRVYALGLTLCTLAIMLLPGCGGGPSLANVSGEVKVDGIPLEKGVITFVPAEGKGQPVTGDVVHGKYHVRTTVGKNIVMISAPVVIDKRKDAPTDDANWLEITTESLPDKYHSKTTLSFEVQSGSNTKDWDLKVNTK
jgi:hypothetical protein